MLGNDCAALTKILGTGSTQGMSAAMLCLAGCCSKIYTSTIVRVACCWCGTEGVLK